MTKIQKEIARAEARILREYVRIMGLDSPIATAIIHGAEAMEREAEHA